jgi:hypothetical protein
MVTQILKWQTKNGQQFDTKDLAETQELVDELIVIVLDTAKEYDTPVTKDEAIVAVDLLVNTDLFSKLTVHLKGKL